MLPKGGGGTHKKYRMCTEKLTAELQKSQNRDEYSRGSDVGLEIHCFIITAGSLIVPSYGLSLIVVQFQLARAVKPSALPE